MEGFTLGSSNGIKSLHAHDSLPHDCFWDLVCLFCLVVKCVESLFWSLFWLFSWLQLCPIRIQDSVSFVSNFTSFSICTFYMGWTVLYVSLPWCLFLGSFEWNSSWISLYSINISVSFSPSRFVCFLWRNSSIQLTNKGWDQCWWRGWMRFVEWRVTKERD